MCLSKVRFYQIIFHYVIVFEKQVNACIIWLKCCLSLTSFLSLLYRVRDLSHQNIVICYILFSLKKQLPKPQSKLHKLSNLWQADAYLLS